MIFGAEGLSINPRLAALANMLEPAAQTQSFTVNVYPGPGENSNNLQSTFAICAGHAHKYAYYHDYSYKYEVLLCISTAMQANRS